MSNAFEKESGGWEGTRGSSGGALGGGGGGVELSINLLNCFKILYNTLTDGVFAISSMYA